MDVLELLPKLIRASLANDKKSIEALALMIAKKIKKENPLVSNEITRALVYSSNDISMARSIDMQIPPVDKDTRFSLISVTEPIEIEPPVVDDYVMQQLNDFMTERGLVDVFLREGIVPPNSLLLVGKPGVGKTYITSWLSYKLNLPLVTLNLASSISSYLGRTGQNIQSVFSYAKTNTSILFLDELDAIAKKRDDASDLGELKRLVNVLLKELEDCPSSCVIIGATNHPELLDKAIWRRFDRALTVHLPGEHERGELLQRHLGKYNVKIESSVKDYMIRNSAGISAAEVCKLCEHIKRQVIMNPESPVSQLALSELFKVLEIVTKEEKIEVCKTLREKFPELSLREISLITRIPHTSVSRYVSQNSKEELQ